MDRYQGRDKSLIVFSFVKSTSEEGNVSRSDPICVFSLVLSAHLFGMSVSVWISKPVNK